MESKPSGPPRDRGRAPARHRRDPAARAALCGVASTRATSTGSWSCSCPTCAWAEEQGRAALRADFERQLRATGVSFLQVGNHVVDFESEDVATGVVYCRGEIQEGGRESSRWIVQLIQYHDRYELRAGRWLFVRRKHLLVYGAELGQNPLGLAPAEWPRSQTGWGTVPEGLASWQRFWKTHGG